MAVSRKRVEALREGPVSRRPVRLLAAGLEVVFLTFAAAASAPAQEIDTLLGESPADPPPVIGVAEGTSSEAAAPPGRRSIEEVLVTAQRTEQSLLEVPISMSVLGADFLEQENVANLLDISRYVPNLRMRETGSLVETWVRGFGTFPVQPGFQQAVGIVVDEIPYGGQQYFQSGLLDLERIEILRGPQGQLFGKNTTVGLFNLTTRNPTDELEGFVDVDLGELDRRGAQAAVGGPLLPGVVNFRLSGVVDERDGYFGNTTARLVPEADDRLEDRERNAARLKLAFPDLLGASLLVSYERSEVLGRGWGREITFLPEKFHNLFRQFDPDIDLTAGNHVASLDYPTFVDNEIDILVARGSYGIGDWTIDAVAGWARLDTRTDLDADGNPLPVVSLRIDGLISQTTAEIRATSPSLPGPFGLGRLFGLALGSTDLTGGVFYQRRSLDPSFYRTTINGTLIGALIFLNGAPAGPQPSPLGEEIRPDVSESDEALVSISEQTDDTIAGFLQTDWHFLERWTLVYGMRLSHTKKDATFENFFDPDGTILRAQAEEFTAVDNRSEFHFAPKVGVIHDWSDDVNFFAMWVTSFREGGFLVNPLNDDPSTRRFDSESVASWEIGSKMRLLDGAADLRVGLFWMELTDFQLLTFRQGVLLPERTVANAGKLRARGVEVESTWLPTTWLTIRGGLGFNDTKYLDFPFGSCANDRIDTDDSGDNLCDLTGRPLDNAPQWDISLSPMARLPLTSMAGARAPSWAGGFEIFGGLTVQFVDTHYTYIDLDPRTIQGSFFHLSGSFGFANPDQGWSLGVAVENLTDAVIAQQRSEIVQVNGGRAQQLMPPRLVTGRFRWSF